MFYKRMVELDQSLLRECTEYDPDVDFVSIEQYNDIVDLLRKERQTRQKAQVQLVQCWDDRKRGN